MQHGRYISLSNSQRDQLLSQNFNNRVGLLQKTVADDALEVRDDVEKTVLSQVVFGLVFDSDRVDGNPNTHVELFHSLDGDTYFGDYSDSSALRQHIATSKSECPDLFLKSVSWTIQSTDKRDALSSSICDFVAEAVLSNGANSIRDIEVGIQPISTSLLSLIHI